MYILATAHLITCLYTVAERNECAGGNAMVPKVRIMHYINQFFAGVGGEEKAKVPVGFSEGLVGPGKRLQELLADSAEIIVTAILR